MRYDIDVYGVFVPSLLLSLVISYALCAALCRLFRRSGLYRIVWHRAMFDFAVFICLLGVVVYLSSEFLS
jgi:hypothetical protein